MITWAVPSNFFVGNAGRRIGVMSGGTPMYLTNEHLVGGKDLNGSPEDLTFIVKYSWPSPKHMKEAIKILLSARLDGGEDYANARFDGEITEETREVQLRLASNPETSEEVLEYLRKVGNARVCERVAQNPRCSEMTLRALAEHADPQVRASICENAYCPITILYRLAKDEHPDVRYCLAENPNLPNSILEELCEDENPFVNARAHSTLRRLSCGTVIEGPFVSYEMIMPGLRAVAVT